VNYGRSLAQRVVETAVLLLLAALALRWAVQVVASVLWPLLGMAAAVIVGGAGWRVWQRTRGGW